MIEIHGKPYETVAERVRKFREICPASLGWAIVPEIIEINGKLVRMQVKIVAPNGQVVAIGHAEEFREASYINKTSALENCETSAIGRALMAAGFGGGEFASADEVLMAIESQKEIEQVLKKPVQKKPETKKPDMPVSTDLFLSKEELINRINESKNIFELRNVWKKYQPSMNLLNEFDKQVILAAKDEKKQALEAVKDPSEGEKNENI